MARNSAAGRKAALQRSYGLISVAGVIGRETVIQLGCGHQANCLIVEIIIFDLTISKSQIGFVLGFSKNVHFFFHLT